MLNGKGNVDDGDANQSSLLVYIIYINDQSKYHLGFIRSFRLFDSVHSRVFRFQCSIQVLIIILGILEQRTQVLVIVSAILVVGLEFPQKFTDAGTLKATPDKWRFS